VTARTSSTAFNSLAGSVPARSVVLFDGICNLCNGMVAFVIARDPGARFAFGALQSAAARTLLQDVSAPEPLPDSVVLLEGRRVYTKIDGGAPIARGLRFPWPLALAFFALPRPVRDWLYDVVARNRYRWFGQRAVCMMPTPELQRRFIS
jgi:predicted DCC family thiol-disulfide oxidoreductase YuxK